MGEIVKHTPAISRELMGLIVDEVFDGAIEDTRVIEDIYAVIKRHEASPPMTSPVSAIEAIEAIEKATEGVRADRIERLWWFLHILDKSCGTTNANDDQWNWINAFCTDFEDDTFNRAAKLGFIRVTHNDLSEDSTARLTDAGKAFAAYFKDSPSSAAARKAEALERALQKIEERVAGGTVVFGQSHEMTAQRVRFLEKDIRDIIARALLGGDNAGN